MKLIKNITLAAVLGLSSLSAHTFWVTSTGSFEHAPGHALVGLGWGHVLPFDDRLNSGRVHVDEFSITSPDNEKTLLKVPTDEGIEATNETKDFEVFDANVGLQKIGLKKDSTKGTYLIHAKQKPTFYTHFIDTKDRKRIKLTTKDKIKNIKKVLFSVKWEGYGSSYLTLGKWSEQKAKNKGFEIVPKSDLSNLKAGDMVEFEVLFYGKPYDKVAKKGEAKLTLFSNPISQGEGLSLTAPVYKGIAKFAVPSKGQWMIMAILDQKVKKEGELKDLHGKVNSVMFSSTLTFHVK